MFLDAGTDQITDFNEPDNAEVRISSGNVLTNLDGNGTTDISLTGLTSASQLTASDFAFV